MFSQGFSKIELLIFILLIIILIIADIVIVSHLRTKEKDVQVLSEISQIRSGLENFLYVNSHYPIKSTPVELNDSYENTQKLCIEGFVNNSYRCSKNILAPVPNKYLAKGNSYQYKSIDNDRNYQLEFTLQSDFSKLGLTKGVKCATNTQILNQACF